MSVCMCVLKPLPVWLLAALSASCFAVCEPHWLSASLSLQPWCVCCHGRACGLFRVACRMCHYDWPHICDGSHLTDNSGPDGLCLEFGCLPGETDCGVKQPNVGHLCPSLSVFLFSSADFWHFHSEVETLCLNFSECYDITNEYIFRETCVLCTRFWLLRKSEIRTTCLFFLPVFLSCLTFLWSYSVLSFWVGPFQWACDLDANLSALSDSVSSICT